MPHQQLDQRAPPELQEELFRRACLLPGVKVGPSSLSVPGARAFRLDEPLAKGPREAFMMGAEFGHLHPPSDGSMHVILPPKWIKEAREKGWAEPHPMAHLSDIARNVVMVYGPRDTEELEVVWRILQASHAFASGQKTGW